jgi:hypothetical protein
MPTTTFALVFFEMTFQPDFSGHRPVSTDDSAGPREATRLDALLHDPVVTPADRICPFATDLGHGLDEVRSPVYEPDPIIGGKAVR